jgi:hypothetical protein
MEEDLTAEDLEFVGRRTVRVQRLDSIALRDVGEKRDV